MTSSEVIESMAIASYARGVPVLSLASRSPLCSSRKRSTWTAATHAPSWLPGKSSARYSTAAGPAGG